MLKCVKTLCIALSIHILMNPISAWARPVSYVDSWTIMLRNDSGQNSLHLHYTPDRHHSIGARLRYDREQKSLFTGIQLNRLVKRWNQADSQANFYAKSAIGIMSDQQEHAGARTENELGYMLALAADWETRRWFLGAEAEHWNQGHFGPKTEFHSRIGIAPYIANSGALHTWVMLETHYRPDEDENMGTTALIRLFKGPALLELGLDDDGEALLNYIHRY